MKQLFSFFFLCVCFLSESRAAMISPSQSCDVEMIAIGKGTSTPLHKEAERVLQYKGYKLRSVVTSSAFEDSLQSPYSFQVHYRVGNVSPSRDADCIIEDYRALGKRATCEYELKFSVRDEQGLEKNVFHLRQSIRQSLDLEGFHDRVRSELARLPQCIQFI